jgi:hypothetical protein
MKSFKNVDAVLAFLTSQGYQVSRPTLFRHRKAGKLVASPDGTFTEAAVTGYAATFLTRAADAVDDGVEDVAKVKALADAKRSQAMATLAEERAKRESGQYVPKADFDRALAQRALLFKMDLKNFAHAGAPEICAVVDGDHTLVPDLILLLLRKFEDFLDRYAQPGVEWEIPNED